MKTFFDNAFYSLKNRNFRLYFIGQFFSLAGSWMQSVALGWLAYELTGSAAHLGTILGLSTLPLLIFGLVGGAFGQRYENFKILVWTQLFYGVMPVLVSIFYFTGNMNLSILYIAALWVGLMRIVDQPVRQGFMSTVVGKSDLKNAISLFATVSAFARIVGPLLAGVFMQSFGAGFCFLFNGLSFFFMSYIILSMDKSKFYINESEKKEKNIWNSVVYIYNNKKVFNCLFLGAMLGTFVYIFQTTFPVFAKTVFSGNVLSYSVMMTFFSLGAICGGLFTAGQKDLSLKKVRNLGIFLSVIYFMEGVVSDLNLFLFVIFIFGFFLIQFTSTVNTILQTNTENKHLNVVMSFWSMGVMGMASIGGVVAGVMSDMVGIQNTIFMISLLVLVCVLSLARDEKLSKV
jgi:MFS family permease